MCAKKKKKMKQKVLLCADIVIPNQGQGHWKRYKMVTVNGNYKHGRYEENLVEN